MAARILPIESVVSDPEIRNGSPLVAGTTLRVQQELRMPQVTFDFPPTVFSALRKSPAEFAAEMRLAAAIHWYSQEMVSQGKAAEIAGLSRAQFLEELFRRKVPAIQVTLEELREELRRE